MSSPLVWSLNPVQSLSLFLSIYRSHSLSLVATCKSRSAVMFLSRRVYLPIDIIVYLSLKITVFNEQFVKKSILNKKEQIIWQNNVISSVIIGEWKYKQMIIQTPFIPSIGAHLRSKVQLSVSATAKRPFLKNYDSRDLRALNLDCQKALLIRISRSGKFHAWCTLSQVYVIFRFTRPDMNNFIEIELSVCIFSSSVFPCF